MTQNEHSKQYKRAFTKCILNPLKSEGFKRYKSVDAVRIVGDSILQIINMQKRTGDFHKFTVNVGIRPLYIPMDFIALAPGQRIGMFMNPQKDTWWSYETEADTEQSFAEVLEIINQKIMPWFDDLSTTKGIIHDYENEKYKVFWREGSWKTLDLGNLYLRDGNYERAQAFLQATLAETADSDHPVDRMILEKCQAVLRALEGGTKAIEQYFEESEQFTRKAIGLLDW